LSTALIGPSNPTSVVAFGAGKQIQAHLLLHLQHYPSIRTCTVVTRSASSPNIHELKAVLEPRSDSVEFKYITYSPSSASEEDTEEVVKKFLLDASIIICATSSTRPLFPSSWVRAGTHVILVGSFKPEMREVDKELVLRAVSDFASESRLEGNSQGMLLVDSRPVCQIEAGDIISAGVGEDSMVEIGELCSRRASTGVPGVSKVEFQGERTSQGPITLFKSVGLGIQDVAIACAVVKRAEEMEIGTYIKDYDV
jgi:ornithine cyclodeaminase/alanine dehydrogenase-like protein (mu-crystallin family)